MLEESAGRDAAGEPFAASEADDKRAEDVLHLIVAHVFADSCE